MSKTLTSRTGKSETRAKGGSALQSTGHATNGSADAALFDGTACRAMIAEAAYYRAERRGFAPGFELEDWLLSENELAAQIQSQSLQRSPSGSSEVH